MSSKFILIILIGFFIRLFLAGISFHPDIVHFDLAGQIIRKGNILNFYDYTFKLDNDDQLLKSYPRELFNYPPAVYFSLGSILAILSSISNIQFHNNFIFNTPLTMGDPRLILHLILLKIPYLVFDFAIAYFLCSLFTNNKDKMTALVLWIFNPVNLYVTYMIGQFDIIPTFFVIAALFLVSKESYHTVKDLSDRKVLLSSLLLGVGASFKIFPLLFLIPLATLLPGWKKKMTVLVMGISVYLITILPFLRSADFRRTALIANQTLKSFFAQIPISGGESIILYPLLILFFYLILIYKPLGKKPIWQRFFIIILLFFIFTHYHPQWFLWLVPFFIIELIITNFRHLFVIILILISFIGLVSFFEPSLSLGLFSPINPALLNVEPIWKQLGFRIDYNFARSLLQTIFVGCALYFIYQYFPKREE